MLTLMKSSQYWLRIAVAAGCLWIVAESSSMYWPVIVSLFLAIILLPLSRIIQRGIQKAGWKQVPVDVPIIISFVIFGTLVFSLFQVIVVPFFVQLNKFLQNFSVLMGQLALLPEVIGRTYSFLEVPVQVQQVINDTIIKVGNYGIDMLQRGVQAVFNAAGAVVELFVVPIITFYFMKDGARMRDNFIELFPAPHRLQLAIVLQEIREILGAYLTGQLIMSCIISTVIFIGMWSMDIPYSILIAALAAVTEWIPIIGPIIGAVPAVALGAVMGFSVAAKVLIFYIIVQQIDGHIIMPKVMGSAISLHPVVIVIALLVAGALFGVKGMMLAVPVTAILQVLAKHMWYYNRYKRMVQHTQHTEGKV